MKAAKALAALRQRAPRPANGPEEKAGLAKLPSKPLLLQPQHVWKVEGRTLACGPHLVGGQAREGYAKHTWN